ncbi:MAG: DUF2723 domain-containing protein [Acidobacteria bacterium]|nr:DUF2723 domain-containing protein [Acidobacteriota bacterium]MSO62490.1 DUF2723 domain-containing protein [Acidobacteriota bacterium]
MVRRRDALCVATLALSIGALYLATLRPDVGGTEDSPKFQFLGQVLGTAHSPGYPFYTMATYLFTRVPLGTLAYRVNLFSAVCGVLGCLCIFWITRRLGVSRVLAVAAALAAATSFPIWSNSVTAEVYTLAALMSALTVLWLMVWAANGRRRWLYAACAVFAAGLGNHLTIVGILPAALIYGIVKDRSVLQPRVIGVAAIIGTLGVVQYGFIALRTLQGAPYLEARATTLQGIYHVIIARDVSWARFYQGADKVVGIEVPILIEGLRAHMSAIAVALVVVAIATAVWRKQSEVLLIAGAAAGTLGMVANLWGDVVGFITPVVVLLWPLSAFGLEAAVRALFKREAAVTVAGAIALVMPVTNVARLHASIEALRQPGDAPSLRALYGNLPAGSGLVVDNYFIARILNYLHFSNEYDPDPNPRLLANDAGQVRAAAAEGRAVFALEGAVPWLTSQGLTFEATGLSRQPFDQWLAQQPARTLVIAAAAGRVLPVEWLPAIPSGVGERPSNFSAFAWTIGSDPQVERSDSGVALKQAFGPDGRVVAVTANDEGPQIQWGDDVLSAVDRGLLVVVIGPSGRIAGNWKFAPAEALGAQVPPAAFVFRGERPCAVLRLGQPTDVSAVLADGGWLATLEGSGKAAIILRDGGPVEQWRHGLWNGRGHAAIDAGRSRLMIEGFAGTRAVFSLSLARPGSAVVATLESGDVTAARVCHEALPEWPSTGTLDVSSAADQRFGEGWHLAERAGTQHYRWAARNSTLRWRMAREADVRFVLRMRAAQDGGATLRASINGNVVTGCTLPAGAWTTCTLAAPAENTRQGVNELVVSSDTVAPARPGDPRELAFVMQPGRVRVGR